MNTSPATGALVPPAVVTKTFRPVAAWTGDTAVICVSERTVKLGAATGPKATDVAPVKPEPVIVTMVPPAVVPDVGETALTTGTGAPNVKTSAETIALVPPTVVTKMLRVPAASAGDTTVIFVSEMIVKLAADVGPKCTLVVPVNPVPVTVITVPPATGPDVGEMAVTTGTGAT